MRKLSSHFVVLIVGLTMGLGTVAMAERGGPKASPSADVASAVRSVGLKVDKLGYKFDAMRREITTTNRKLDVTNGSLAGFTTISPSRSLADILDDIERNTR